jgi:hypothetical protein
MSDTLPLETLITSLVGDLKPTHRLPAPWIRTVFWLAAVLLLAALLAWNADLHSLAERLRAAPDMWLSQAGAMLTAGCAAWAAFQTSIPGRSWRWALLPLPPLALWLAASTAGCLRLWPIPGTEAEPPMHALECLHFIVLISLPLAGLLTWRLTRAFPVRPGLTAMLAGLASAGAAASLLEIIHPFDATASDLLLHLVAVLVVTALSRVAGGAWLKRKEKSLLF